MRECPPMRRLLLIALTVISIAPLAHAQRRRVVGPSDTIVIGGLFSLTGDGATLGKASQAALDLAARDINAELAALRLSYRVQTAFADTRLTPAGAVDGIQSLH